MPKENNSKEEEIELGSLFIIIGKGFSNLFNFIGNIFKGIYHSLICILLFIKTHFIKLLIATIIGGVIGTFLEIRKETTFSANLKVNPNFESVKQLYNNVNYYDDLVKQKDTILLAKTFSISTKEASSLKKFRVYPTERQSHVLMSYDRLISSIDSLTAKSYSFAKFERGFMDYDYRIHNVEVIATDSRIFSKLGNIIVTSITENEYFNNLKVLTNKNLDRTYSLLHKNLSQIDSLGEVYIKVMIEEAQKKTAGTNIDLGGEKKSTKELELFETTRKVNAELIRVNMDKAEKSKVINVISQFQPVGHEIKGITKNYGFLGSVFGVVLVIMFLLFKQLNMYLSSYKK